MRKRPKRNTVAGGDVGTGMLRGALLLSRAVAVTYGPHGRTALVQRMAGLLSTKDGASVAREIRLSDPLGDLGCRLLNDACRTVNDGAGDGTTTAAVLAGALLVEGRRILASGADPVRVVRGIREATGEALSLLQGMARPVTGRDGLERVANVACNGDSEISSLLADACMAAGDGGLVLVEDGRSTESSLDLRDGMEIENGPASVAFFVGPTLSLAEDNPVVAVINAPLRSFADVKPVAAASIPTGRALVVMAPEISGEALANLCAMNSTARARCVAIPAPGVGDEKAGRLRDVAALSGAAFVDPAAGMNFREWKAEWFGSLRKATIMFRRCCLEAPDGTGEATARRAAELRAERGRSGSDHDRDLLDRRIAGLSGGVAVLRVGGVTEAALKERRARVEDALGAVRAALRDGVVPGGGTAFLRAAEGLRKAPGGPRDPDVEAGRGVVIRALGAPTRTLAENAGASGGTVAARILSAGGNDPWIGWDALSGDVRPLGDAPMVADPLSVASAALSAAASVASTILTVGAAVLEGR